MKVGGGVITTTKAGHGDGKGCAQFHRKAPARSIVGRTSGRLDGLADEGNLLLIRPIVDHVDDVEDDRPRKDDP
ncbi:MAG: hypothetical protein IPK59_23125 [Rhodospirillaceae bacterium]|nr:hypothetical protein [Rhodospirillaceae bacterium]